jgi:hypothetical protein
MSDDMIYPTEPPAAEPSPAAKVMDAVQGASETVRAAIDEGRRPGHPLDRLNRLIRETPLRCLLIAFLCGAFVARRR